MVLVTKKKTEPGPAAKALRELRMRAGFTYREMAEKMGFGEASSTYSSKELTFKGEHLPATFVNKLADVVVGRGDPEITREDVLALGGLAIFPAVNKFRKNQVEPAEQPEPRFEYHGAMYGRIAGYSSTVTVDAGPGALNPEFPEPDVYHLFPLSWIRGHSRAPLEKLSIISVRGDSMFPTFHNGDQILMDQTVHSIGADGFYVVSMGDGVVVKRVSKDFGSRTLNIASDNPLAQTWHGISEDDVYILGRVLWLGRAV